MNEKARDSLGEKRKEGVQTLFQVTKPQMLKQNYEEGPFGWNPNRDTYLRPIRRKAGQPNCEGRPK